MPSNNNRSITEFGFNINALCSISLQHLKQLIIPPFSIVFQTWFGVGGSVLKWFTSYLSERYQSIKIGSTLSDLCKLLFGLGPLLFSLYTIPLILVIGKHKGVKFHCYADNIQVYIPFEKVEQVPGRYKGVDVSQ